MIFQPILEIIRLEESEVGTFGILKLNKQVWLWTLEPPDFENEAYVSSIPAQQYTMKRHFSPKHGETFIVDKVPGRSGILFHSGNYLEHTEGCILLGLSLIRGDKRGISEGKLAHEAFMKELQGHNFAHLTIIEVF